MAQKKIDFFGQFRPTGVDPTVGAKAAALAGLGEQIGDIVFEEAKKQRIKQGRKEGMEAAQTAVEEGQAPEMRGSFTFRDQAYNQAVQDSYLSSIGVEMTRKIAEAETNYGDDIAAFEEIITAEKQGMLNGLDPNFRLVAEQVMDKQTAGAMGRVSARTIEKNKQIAAEQRLEAVSEMSREAVRLTRLGDTEGAQLAHEEALLNVSSLIESGDIAEDKAAELVRGIQLEKREQELKYEFQGMTLTEKQSKLSELINKPEKGWSPDEWDSMINELGAGVRASRSELEATAKELKEQIQRTKTELEKGSNVSNSELMQLYSAAEEVNAAYGKRFINADEFRREINEAKQTRHFSLQPKKERKQILNTLRQAENKGLTTEQAELKRRLESIDKKIEAEISKDALGFANTQGIVTLNPIDDSSPETIIESMKERKKSALMASAHYGQDVGVLTKDEAVALANNYNKLDSTQKTALIGAMVDGLGDMAPSTFAEISKNNGGAMAVAGGIALTGGDASLIHDGIEVIATNKQVLPKKAGMDDNFDREIGQRLGGLYKREHRAAIVGAIKAAYAGLSERAGDLAGAEDANEERLDQAIQVVTGGVIEYDPTFSAEPQKIEAPVRGMTADQFEDQMELFGAEHVQKLGGVMGIDPERAAEIIREESTLQSIGYGQYLVTVGRFGYLTKEDGEPFVLDWETAFGE